MTSCHKKEVLEAVVVKSDDKELQLVNGTLVHKDVPFTGTLYHYDALNKTDNETQYVSGKKEGVEIKKYSDQTLAEERHYKQGLKVGIHKGYWQNGDKKFEYHYKKGVYDGSFKEWYSNGQLVKDFHYRNGKEDGAQKMWRSDGKIRANYVVKNGERFGLIGLKKCYTVTAENEEI